MSDKPPSKTIFIGNIPYALSEEQVIQLLSSAGQVLSFRLVTDNDTGKPKGYGFAEFADADAAASAVRNLNGYQTMGRELRVDFSHKDNSGGGGGGGGGGAGQRDGMNMPIMTGAQPQNPPINIPSVPLGKTLPPGVSCQDDISQTLAQIPQPQLLDILRDFKGVVTANPDSAAELLRQQPQLAYAIFQCLVTMGLADATVLKTVVDGASGGAIGGAIAAPGGAVATPPVNPVQAYQPPNSAPPQPIMNQPPQPQIPPEQLQAIKSILAMPPEQYNALGPGERGQVDTLRAQYGHLIR